MLCHAKVCSAQVDGSTLRKLTPLAQETLKSEKACRFLPKLSLF